MKKRLLLSLALLLLLGQVTTVFAASAQETLKLQVDTETVAAANDAEAPYINANGRTLVSLRHLKLALPQIESLEYDKANSKVVVKAKTKLIELYFKHKYILVNGKKVEIDTLPITRKGITYLPVRYIAEALGYRAEFDSGKKTIYVLSAKDNNFARYGLVQTEEFPVTLKAGSFELTYHDMYIYPVKSVEGKAMEKEFYLNNSDGAYKYYVKSKITIKNTGTNKISFSASDVSMKYRVTLGGRNTAYSITPSNTSMIKEFNSKKYLYQWALDKGESVTSNIVFGARGDSVDYVNVAAFLGDNYTSTLNVAE
ncbi:copper amine oxidase N-terminal domain-containing protein [Paenibacillus sp. NEAU-GSW1]|uniref:copper amine oxidase N-terminal domain-containing protein n=1 Tax=Paenibacillus sp. NEAU-GSW1 TaxID=2682486 RepID=UPI0012E2E58C|nr:copper amine oxidase N-terminal domain-containing protein [Paenibacillus sp. NEAU-GSW1]MUT67784.1 hypothetical protein [Paenibacillus sp. NEAU-GSW1]